MASTTIDTETELSAVNAILGAIGQAPVTSLGNSSSTTTTSDGTTFTTSSYENPEIAFIYNLLRDTNVDVQSEGWHFNTEKHVPYTPDSTTGKILIGSDILRIDTTNGWSDRTHDVVRRSGYLYDKQSHSYDFSGHTTIDLDIVKLLPFADLPESFKRYIIYKASVRAATQLVGNPQLAQLLSQQEGLARASVMEYECNQGNHTMFGLPEESVYTAYQPWRSLRR